LVFLEEAYSLIAKSSEAVRRARQAASGLAGSLKIAYLESTVQNFLPAVIKIFRKKYPNVNLHLDILQWEELNKAIAQGDIDVGFTVSFALQNWTGIMTKTIYTDTLCAVLPADHPLANETTIDLRAVANEPVITLSPQAAPMAVYRTAEICANRGFMANIISQPRLHEGILLMIETGMGIAILPHHLEYYANSSLRFVDFEGDDHSLNIVAAWKKSNTNPSLPLWLSELSNQVQNRPSGLVDKF
jgi:DNA-binding transcriptional LysR family regulator